MKKKTAIVSMLLILSMVMTGCSWGDFVKKLPWVGDSYDPEEYLTFTIDYKGLEVDKTVDETVEENLNKLLLSSADPQPIKGRTDARMNDTVNINYNGTMDGKEFDGGKADKQDLELGSGSMIPGFEEGIVGMKVGATKDIKVKFPDPYQNNPDFSGKEAVFKVKLNKLATSKVPLEATDANIAKATGDQYKTVNEYKEGTKKQVKDQINSQAMQTYMESVTVKSLPQEYVDEKIKENDFTMRYGITQQGQDFNTFLTQYQMTEEAYNEEIKKMAESVVKTLLVCQYIIDKEGADITDEDEEELTKILKDNYAGQAQQTGQETKEVTQDELAKQVKDTRNVEYEDYFDETMLQKKAMDIVGQYVKKKE